VSDSGFGREINNEQALLFFANCSRCCGPVTPVGNSADAGKDPFANIVSQAKQGVELGEQVCTMYKEESAGHDA
jgi:hypothetical protein